MMRSIIAIILFGISAIGAHFLTLHLVPSVIMNATQTRLADQGLPPNQWAASPRMTPQTQTIVRPSPDLSYSICRFDVREGAVLIKAPGWDGYGSLSVFDARTNNVFVANLDGEDAGVLLYHPNRPPKQEGRFYSRQNEETIAFSGEGLALIRRLAPDAETHERAVDLVDQAVCAPVNWAP
ncbi:MAG: DUF1254 domain-containing protein [Pseudomonadota bacterium]